MKVLEVKSMMRVRDPHRPLEHALTQQDLFRAKDGYELELHPSGLAAFVRGRDHEVLVPVADVVVDRRDLRLLDPPDIGDELDDDEPAVRSSVSGRGSRKAKRR